MTTNSLKATSYKLAAGSRLPEISWPTIGGPNVSPATQTGWRLVVVYRGKHCPLCKKYLATLDEMLAEFNDAGITLTAVSADPKEKAEAQVSEGNLGFPLAYDLTVTQMQELGLYVSEPRSPQETDRPFAEPGIFVINPNDALQIVDVSNAPFSRPDLAVLLDGIKFIQSKDYPIRGTLE